MRLNIRTLVLLSQVLLLLSISSQSASAQEPLPSPAPTPLTAPPPLKLIPKEEKSQLELASPDTKKRVRLTIEFASAHLTSAEKYTEQGNFDAAASEVGIYHTLIENVLTHLSSLKRDSNKTRDVYKRLELALRADGPRLTAMRRITPLEFAVWIKVVEDYAREGRTEALNSFYGHTVVRETQRPASDKPSNEKPQPEPSPDPKSNEP
jgi:hypothetical protein